MTTEEETIFFDRVTRSLRGDLSPDEQDGLNLLIESDPAKRKESEKLIVTYDLLSLCAATEAQPREIPVEVLGGMRAAAKKHFNQKKSNRRFWLTLFLCACGLIAVLVVGLTLVAYWHTPEDRVIVEYAAMSSSAYKNLPGAYLTDKMNKIIFPTVAFQGATIAEALEYLRVKSYDLDTSTDDPRIKGVRIILRQGDVPANVSLSLDLKNIPMFEALRYIAELAQMKYRVEQHAVLVVPLTESTDDQYISSYRVPPNFLNAIAITPANESSEKNLAVKILESAGINFPRGSSASFNPTTSMLVVRNTPPNLELVEVYVEAITYSLNALDLEEALEGNEILELADESALQEWENKWTPSGSRTTFKILLQERGTWDQPASKFNKYDIGRIVVMGLWHGDTLKKVFTVRSANYLSMTSEPAIAWSKALKDAQAFIKQTIQERGK